MMNRSEVSRDTQMRDHPITCSSALVHFRHLIFSNMHFEQQPKIKFKQPLGSSTKQPMRICQDNQSSSVNLAIICKLKIMTRRPIVTMMSSAKLNQPRIMAVAPTPLRTLPLPSACAMREAATEAVCCHSTDTSTKMEAMKMMASATCDTGRDGNGFLASTEPVSSISSCHPGKVASSRKQMKARMMATILFPSLALLQS